jgi:hypothetical protein
MVSRGVVDRIPRGIPVPVPKSGAGWGGQVKFLSLSEIFWRDSFSSKVVGFYLEYGDIGLLELVSAFSKPDAEEDKYYSTPCTLHLDLCVVSLEDISIEKVSLEETYVRISSKNYKYSADSETELLEGFIGSLLDTKQCCIYLKAQEIQASFRNCLPVDNGS